MKILFAVAAAASPTPAAASCPSQPAPRAAAELRQADRTWADANAQGDVRAMERLLHEDVIVVSGTGALRDRNQELDEIRPRPDLRVHYFVTEDVRLRMCGQMGMVLGIARWRISSGEQVIEQRRRYSSTYVRSRGAWKMIHLQVSGRMPDQQ